MLYINGPMFSDDPDTDDTDDSEDDWTDIDDEEDPLDPKQYCSCGLCGVMEPKAESFCCKSLNYLQADGKTFLSVL